MFFSVKTIGIGHDIITKKEKDEMKKMEDEFEKTKLDNKAITEKKQKQKKQKNKTRNLRFGI